MNPTSSFAFVHLGISTIMLKMLFYKENRHTGAKRTKTTTLFINILCKKFSPPQLLTIYKSQIRPSLEYCSHIWGGAPKSSLHLLDRVHSKAIRLVNNPNFTNSLQPPSHRRLVADLSISYRYFHGHCSQEIKNVIPDPVRRVRATRNPTYSHPFQVTLPNPRTLSHKSSFIPRTSQLWNSLLPTTFPESYNLSSYKSNINKLEIISLST